MNTAFDITNPKLTVAQINAYAKEQNIKLPSKLKKAEKVAFILASLEQDAPTGYRKELITLAPRWMDSDYSWKEHLEKFGWCTVPVPEWEEEFVGQFFDWLESCCENFSRDEPATWKAENMIPLIHGIIKHGMAHTKLQWKIRELCLPLFQELWQTDDLLCSFDGGCFLTPKEKNTTLDYNVKDLWVHVDTPKCIKEENTSAFTSFQIDLPPEMECYQGVVNFVENGEDDGGLVLVENSQHFFHKYMNDYPSSGFKWERANTVSAHFEDATYMKICAHAGELILWDGRVFHCNVPPCNKEEGNFRMCVYVSMQPRSFATKKELEKRKKLYEEGRMTGHWCYGPFFEANAKNPRTYGKSVIEPPPAEIAELNDITRCLVGYAE